MYNSYAEFFDTAYSGPDPSDFEPDSRFGSLSEHALEEARDNMRYIIKILESNKPSTDIEHDYFTESVENLAAFLDVKTNNKIPFRRF
jgi:hypothetical protein